jgi:hypothetical protein
LIRYYRFVPLTSLASVEGNSGSTPTLVAIKEFDTADRPVITAQIDGTRLPSRRNPVTNFYLFARAVRVMNHYSVKLNRAACDTKLDALKSAFASSDPDSVVIPPSAHRRLSQIVPGSGSSDVIQPVERHSRLNPPRPIRPIRPAVAEFDASDSPFITLQVDGARLTTGGNPIPNFEFITCSVRVVNHYALKRNRSARDTKLNALKSTLVSAYYDSVIISLAIDRRLSKINPTPGALSKGCLSDAHEQE